MARARKVRKNLQKSAVSNKELIDAAETEAAIAWKKGRKNAIMEAE